MLPTPKNSLASPAALDLGLGDFLVAQTDEETKKRAKEAKTKQNSMYDMSVAGGALSPLSLGLTAVI